MKKKNNFVHSFISKPALEFQCGFGKGFTLIELMLVCTMVSVIALAIYAVFNNGIEIWQRINVPIPQEDVVIFFDRFASDLRNSFAFEKISFSGDDNGFEFAGLVNSPRLKTTTVGKIAYFYDQQANSLNRKQWDFSQVYNKAEGAVKHSLKNVTAGKFKYYFYDEQKKTYTWLDEWEYEGLPLAVSMEFVFNDGKSADKFTKTVTIPVSNQKG